MTRFKQKLADYEGPTAGTFMREVYTRIGMLSQYLQDLKLEHEEIM